MTDLMDAVALATANAARMYPLNEVPENPQYPYGTFSASLGRGDVFTLDADEGIRWGRVVTQTFGTAESALATNEKVRAALVNLAPEIPGYETTAIRAELDPVVTRDPDTQGVVGVTATYTFTATKES